MPGLYVHIPFCVKKCAYCDFYSLSGRTELFDNYIEAVLQEAAQYQGRAFQTLYLGGGTPSLLGASNLGKLLDGLCQTLKLSGLTEATIEVNPESASTGLFKTARDKGINRVSIGVQSLADKELKSAGRIHNTRQAIEAVTKAKKAGFKSVSADLIIGLPGQNWETLRYSLKTLLTLGIEHLSLYCLSLEPNTPLALNPPANLPSDDEQAELFEQAGQSLNEHGFVHYEISNFTLPGYECQHNLNYWRGGEYVGLGPAAASHLDGKRFKNQANLEDYLDNPTGIVEEIEELPRPEKAAEEAMLRLRLLAEGLDTGELAQRFGERNTVSLARRLRKLTTEGQLHCTGSKYRLTPSRVLTSNPILARVLGD